MFSVLYGIKTVFPDMQKKFCPDVLRDDHSDHSLDEQNISTFIKSLKNISTFMQKVAKATFFLSLETV